MSFKYFDFIPLLSCNYNRAEHKTFRPQATHFSQQCYFSLWCTSFTITWVNRSCQAKDLNGIVLVSIIFFSTQYLFTSSSPQLGHHSNLAAAAVEIMSVASYNHFLYKKKKKGSVTSPPPVCASKFTGRPIMFRQKPTKLLPRHQHHRRLDRGIVFMWIR